jgi:hypothetical protein
VSLKAFHIFFIAVSTLFALGFGAWAVDDWSHTGSAATLALGVASFAGSALLVVYAAWFLKKLKNVGYL